MKKTSHSYFVIMIDHGKTGLEAIVHPEDTRRAIVDQLAHGEYQVVAFIHHVDGLYVEDVTLELLNEAETLVRAEHEDRRDMLRDIARDQAIDHARDLRKEYVA